LSDAISKLQKSIEADFEIPPKYLHNLLTINAWLDKINKTGFGSAPNEGAKAREEILKKRSSTLIFQ
jgi:hypothetical protein